MKNNYMIKCLTAIQYFNFTLFFSKKIIKNKLHRLIENNFKRDELVIEYNAGILIIDDIYLIKFLKLKKTFIFYHEYHKCAALINNKNELMIWFNI